MSNLADILVSGGVAVARTDTLYGVLARADDEMTVERVFEIKGRDRDKPLIILLAEADQAFNGAEFVSRFSEQADKPTTVIVDSPGAYEWLRHDDMSVAYRVPKNKKLLDLLRQTGPLVAPSANPQGHEPANNIEQAKKYFGESVDWYEDDGDVPTDQAPSHIVKIKSDNTVEVLR